MSETHARQWNVTLRTTDYPEMYSPLLWGDELPATISVAENGTVLLRPTVKAPPVAWSPTVFNAHAGDENHVLVRLSSVRSIRITFSDREAPYKFLDLVYGE